MSSFLEQMANFNQRIGKAMPDPTRIEGFGEGQPPPPPVPEEPNIPSAKDIYGDPVEHEMSPLQRVGAGMPPEPPQMPQERFAQPPMPPVSGQGSVQLPELVVLGTLASLSGHEVVLTIQEEATVKEVVIRAIERKMREQRDSLRNILPKRGRPVKQAPAEEKPKKAKKGAS